MPSRRSYIQQADQLVAKPAGQFKQEDSARITALLALADAAAADEGRQSLNTRRNYSARDADFDSYLRSAMMPPAMQKRLRESRLTEDGGAFPGSASFVPVGFAERFFTALKAVDNLISEDVCTFIETAKGSAWALPIASDVSVEAIVVAEGVETTYADVNLGVLQLGECPTLRSQGVLASTELTQDFGYDIESFLAGIFAVRFARKLGSLNVAALKAAAVAGATSQGAGAANQSMGGSTSASTSLSTDDLLACAAALDSAYAANAHWVLNRKTLMSIAGIRGTTGQLALKVHRDPDTGLFILLGAPCLICPSMDDIGTSGNVPTIFGDPKFFVTRAVRNSLTVQVSSQFAAESGKMLYQAYWRAQGGVATPNLSPLPPAPFTSLVQGS